ncbi:retrovirus-related pol polyprotein from transposon TNT 1-94 [Tanacetum coccineum]|uniref:Retrovirus-related pol polyprotein from transposon TNT 1-94 n=1 Tax=Tanacetum coccineum TaxID=301880 RepID=A0ABQ5GZP6_9ASTR
MHNNIMAAGKRDRPLMLATGRYAQWRSRFLRYIDSSKVLTLQLLLQNQLFLQQRILQQFLNKQRPKQFLNMTLEKHRCSFESKKEAIHLILTGIGDEIYSTVDACQKAQEMGSHRKATTSTSRKSTNLPAPTPPELHKHQTKNVDTTLRYKNDNQTGQFRNQRAVNVVGARETIGGHVVQQSGTQCFNCKKFGHYAKECRKPKWVKDSTYHKEKMLLCKQVEKGVQLQAEHLSWLAYTYEEND